MRAERVAFRFCISYPMRCELSTTSKASICGPTADFKHSPPDLPGKFQRVDLSGRTWHTVHAGLLPSSAGALAAVKLNMASACHLVDRAAHLRGWPAGALGQQVK